MKKTLNIGITNPFTWPFVRRGAERLLNDLAVYFMEQGHRVHTFAMAPADDESNLTGIHASLIKERIKLPLRQLNSCHYFAAALQKHLKKYPLDVVHCLTHFDAYAAITARKKYGLHYKVVFQSVGIPVRAYFKSVPLDRFFFLKALEHADTIVVLSRFAQKMLKKDFNRDARILPAPVAVDDFTPDPTMDRPSNLPGEQILFSGDVTEIRKGAAPLCRAFAAVKKKFPHASLILSGNIDPPTKERLISYRGVTPLSDDIIFTDVGKIDQLPRLYRQSNITVLPAVWEAFGLVLVESLASGTPVVGVNHGGIPDIVTSPKLGRLVDPGNFQSAMVNVDGLTRAIIEVLNMQKDAKQYSAIRNDCRRHAEKYSCKSLGPAYETLYFSLVN